MVAGKNLNAASVRIVMTDEPSNAYHRLAGGSAQYYISRLQCGSTELEAAEYRPAFLFVARKRPRFTSRRPPCASERRFRTD